MFFNRTSFRTYLVTWRETLHIIHIDSSQPIRPSTSLPIRWLMRLTKMGIFTKCHVLTLDFSSSQSQPSRASTPPQQKKQHTHTPIHNATTPTQRVPPCRVWQLCLGSLCSCSWRWTEDDTMGWSSWEASAVVGWVPAKNTRAMDAPLSVVYTLRIQVCPKKGITPTFLF